MVRTGEYNPKKSCIKVLRHMELDVSIPVICETCDFCGKCVEWCFAEAIRFVDWEEAALIRKGAKIGCFPSPVVSSGS
jgi:Fe-S-cluster-containing hydrogenase component 2